jgi:hypothetical protein
MHRLFRRVIIYFCLFNSLNFLEGKQNIPAWAANESKNLSKTEKSIQNKDLPIDKKKTDKKIQHDPILVPPPPPDQPSLLEWSGGGIIPDSFNLLNEEELKEKLSRIRIEITDAEANLADNKLEITESKNKAERFVSLYSEGVVSRKELELAQKNIVQTERLAQEAKGNLEDLKAQENAILRRLNNLKKSNKVKSHPLKKKVSNVEKK